VTGWRRSRGGRGSGRRIDGGVSRTAPALARAQREPGQDREIGVPNSIQTRHAYGRPRRRLLHLHLGTPFLRARRRSLCAHAIAARWHEAGLRQASRSISKTTLCQGRSKTDPLAPVEN
jgi:hypothetical protein